MAGVKLLHPPLAHRPPPSHTHTHTHRGAPLIFLDWSFEYFEHQFNSDSRTSSKKNRQMAFPNVRCQNTAVSNNKRSNYKIENFDTDMAYCCIIVTTRKSGPFVTFSAIKVKVFDSSTLVYICLHSSSDSSTLVYTRLVTCLHLSTFLYIRLWLVYIHLHLSTFVFKIDPFFYAWLHFCAPHVKLMCTDYKITARFYIDTLQRNFQIWGARNLFLM